MTDVCDDDSEVARDRVRRRQNAGLMRVAATMESDLREYERV